MGGSLYVSLFEAAEAATQARLNQQAATAQMTDNQAQILNAVNNSWTQSIPTSDRFSVTASKYRSWMSMTQLKNDVMKEIQEGFTGYNEQLMPGAPSSNFAGWSSANTLSNTKREALVGLRQTPGLDISHTHTSTLNNNYQVKGITSSCAKAVLSKLIADGCTSQLSVLKGKPSHVTLLELTDHMASIAKNTGTPSAIRTEMQALLGQAQRSFQAAQANADAGVQAAQNQSEQDSYFMQQDALLATTTNASLQQTAGMTISS